MNKVLCGNCGESIHEPSNIEVDDRLACIKCGSKARKFFVEFSDSANISDTLSVTLITYPNAILTIARDLIMHGYFNIAIVTSHMACEIASERAFDAEYAAKNLSALGEAVDELMNGHSLGNTKHRKLYNSLSGVKIEQKPFWNDFKKASEKRNLIVHKGGQANKLDAEKALDAATQLITYLKQI